MLKRLVKEDCIGDTGIHMSTSVPLETLLRLELYKEFNFWYINIYTLIRNFLDCIEGDTDDKVKMFKKHQFDRFVKELSNDINVIAELLGDKITVYLYRPDYTKLSKNLDNFKQLDEFTSIRYYLLKYQKQISESVETNIKFSVTDTNHRLPKNNNVLITTHIPMDLLNFSNNHNVFLLESFTGVLKGRKEWNTKYHKLGKKDMSVFPFYEELYWILGDNMFIKPQPVKVREQLYKVALDKNWNSSTGKNKMLYDLHSKMPDLYKQIKSIKRFY